MIKVLVIAEREIRERSFVFLAAAALAVAPFLALLVPSGSFADRMSATTWLGLILAAAFVIGLGILLGVSLIGRESREKRLSFYFARPVSGSVIWFGKLLAAATLLGGSAAIMYAPGIILGPPEWRGVWDLSIWKMIGVILIFAASLVLFFHTAATMIRSRSLLLAFDFIAAVAFLVGLFAVLLPILVQRPGLRLAAAMTATLGGAISAVLMFAGAWQLSRGRVDPRRSHRQLSLAVWCALAVVLAGATAGAHWFTAVTPGDLTTFYLPWVPSKTGSAVVVSGPTRHRFGLMSSFLINTETGAWEPIRQSLGYNDAWINSAGTVAVWPKPSQPIAYLGLWGQRDSGEYTLQVSRLRGTKWETRDSGIMVKFYRGAPFVLQISPVGDRMAVLSSDTLTIFNLADGRSLGSARLPQLGRVYVRFVGADAVTVIILSVTRPPSATGTIPPRGDAVVYRYDTRTRNLRQLLTVSLPANGGVGEDVSPDGRTLTVDLFNPSRPEARQFREFDLTTGAEKTTIVTTLSNGFASWRMRDGTTVADQTVGGRVSLEVRAKDGALLRSIDLGPAEWLRTEGELPDGRLLISLTSTQLVTSTVWSNGAFGSNEGVRDRYVVAVDPKSGAVARLADNLRLVGGGAGAQHAIFPAFDSSGLVAWNAMTGERRLLVARH
jgi:hypothetical protein